MSKQLVQERVAAYLIAELGVPEEMVELDTPLSEYQENIEGSIDLTVVYEDEDGLLVPFLVVLCLDDDVEMTPDVVEKCMERAQIIEDVTSVDRMIITNGDEMMYTDARMTNVEGEQDLPTYEIMIKQYEEDMELLKNNPEYEHEHDDDCDCGCHE